MRRLIIVVILGVIGWQGYTKHPSDMAGFLSRYLMGGSPAGSKP